ncbi:MAG TPA: BON domain-containing protein [Kofleriaceae bacterium]|nr:BON domain-containing protein [Kofleriaceae bacterium]
MANHNSSGPGQRFVDDDRTQWRPDDDDRSDGERERRDHRPTERYGQGQSGYSAGRRGEDSSQHYQNRSAPYPPGSFDQRPSPSGMGLDDRFDRTDHRSERADYRPDRPGRDFAGERETGYRSAVYRGMGGHRGKGPQNWQRSDERILETVNEVLTDHDHIDASHIEVHVLAGEVTLSGVVEDRTMKRLAEDCVEQVAGVKEVQNHIRIQRHDGRSTAPEGHGKVNGDASPPVGDRKPRA